MTAIPYLQGDQLLERFQALDLFLRQHQSLWRPRPFVEPQPRWTLEHAPLANWLRTRSLAEAEAAQADPQRLQAPAPFPALAAQAVTLASLGELPDVGLHPAGHRLDVGVPGRKWQQIEAFGRRLAYRQAATHWLDWCSGKGHLGRRLLQPGQRLTCLEHDSDLVRAGQALSDHHRLPATHVCQDVLAPGSARHLGSATSAVALHACGDLHVHLLRLASQQGCHQVAVAPCCYNRIQGTHYQPLSTAARASSLQLSLDDLGLALNEAVTSGARARRQRDLSMARRLAFDLLQRRQRHSDQYLSTPSLPVAWLHKPFEQYCRDLAALKQVPLSGTVDWLDLEAKGWQRLAEVRNLELVRHLFRRPLELWLVLDRALLLGEQGYDVAVGTFCEHALTPRNLLILGERRI